MSALSLYYEPTRANPLTGIRTGSGPGSPARQPRWGGGSDRVGFNAHTSPIRSLTLPVLMLTAILLSCSARISGEPERRSRVQPKSAQVSDVELLHAVAGGDEGALARLYDAHRVILFGLLVRILNSREEAEDVLQDVFIQVWRRARDFDEKRGRPFTWLVTLARSRAIDRLRQLGARQRLAESAERDRPEEASDALSDTIKMAQREIVQRALAELPEEQRHTLVLAYFEGLTQSEIASKLGAPLGTVKTRMRSGMAKLRARLGSQWGSQLENFG